MGALTTLDEADQAARLHLEYCFVQIHRVRLGRNLSDILPLVSTDHAGQRPDRDRAAWLSGVREFSREVVPGYRCQVELRSC
jgi:hypothetical protein